MFTSFPETLRKYGLQADVRTIGELYHCMSRGLVSSLGDLFDTGKLLIVKGKRDIAPYTLAFFNYFLGVETEGARTLDEAIRQSVSFNTWLEAFREQAEKSQWDFDESELVERFLDDVLRSSSVEEIARKLSGEDIFANDDPNQEDLGGGVGGRSPFADALADYRNLDIDEILRRMEQVAKQQKGPHSGGSHWIGTDGISPYGHSGRGLGGVRIGGAGRGKSARKVLGDPEYYPVMLDKVLTDDTIDVALASLKKIADSTVEFKLDIEKTIEEGVKRAGVFIPYLKPITEDRVQVMLFIDNGGYSMRPYAKTVTSLFLKMRRRFTHDLKIFFFHNSIYDRVYRDEFRRDPAPLVRIMKEDAAHRVFIVGDADMAPHELLARYGAIEPREECELPSIEYLRKIAERFPRTVWLNPIPPRSWPFTTADYVMRVTKMFHLTPHGIAQSIEYMNRKASER
ncbi:MAG: hypothetical protein C4532_07990 [Candidatus Abyssobacteria bacterium SURF_17]|uniref:VWA domain-containing protein n=1 Tax=Candidatus Abyssobacteria bacterium SURF_17 TaxID=2093361 RepID=A0A419F098_9BACT|nr:MAG: hypothetical protein C4532_07990 [Candidatus Abyssubacteria bacterium SURF_17]